MKVYHRTAFIGSITAKGFRDGEGTYGTGDVHRGVWVSDVPLDVNEGACGPYVLALDVPQAELLPYEWVEERKPYREFLVPAQVLNRYGPPVQWREENQEAGTP